MGIDKIIGRLLVHIAFYYKESKIRYLKKILYNFENYKFSEIDIVIDTNSGETEKVLAGCFNFKDMKIRYDLHDNIKDPYLLTWENRKDMLKNIDNYDFFMYIEDDILVPWKTIRRWYRDTMRVYPDGYVRGFFRVERNLNNMLVSTDFIEKVNTPNIKSIKGVRYLMPLYPYHAFWIYTKQQMSEFIHHKSWADGNCRWDIRERSAAGMMWNSPTDCRALIPLGFRNNALKDTFVYHLDNHYSLDEETKFAKISMTELILSRHQVLMNKILRRCKNLLVNVRRGS